MRTRLPLASCLAVTLVGLLSVHGQEASAGDAGQTSATQSTSNASTTSNATVTNQGQPLSRAPQVRAQTQPDNDEPGSTEAQQRLADAQRNAQVTPPTDFQSFVQASTGHSLRVFGAEYFRNSSGDLAAARSIAAPVDYVLGSGDEVRISTVGSISIDETATVDRNGMISIPQVGSFTVAGMRMSGLEDYVRAQISKQYRNFQVTVSLGRLRSVQIFVLGEARFPGVYTVSSLSTLVNGLFAAGGPSATGSFRDVQLKRGGVIIAHLDLYDFLLNGDKHSDVRLEPSDVVYIPIVGPQAAVDGDVNKPAIYELRGESTVEDLLRLAGGLTPLAATDRASLDRIVDHQRRVVQDFPLTGAQSLIRLQSGDLLRVFPISPRFDQAVTLRGNVGQPGRYPWRQGMRVSDIIPTRDFLITRRYYNQQNALTPPISNVPFEATARADQDAAAAQETAGRPSNGTLLGKALPQAAAAASSTAAQAVPLSDTAAELGSHETEINWNYAVIERLDPKDLKTILIPFALGEAIDDHASPENKLLEPGDVLTIYSRSDINLPSELRSRFVRIDGEVVRPGIYRLEGEETLRDLVVRAGGISPHGYLYASQFTRESVRLADEAKLQQILSQASRDALSPSNQQVSVTTGTYSSGDLDLRRAYLNTLSQVHATGRVILHMLPTATTANDVPAFSLQDGDRFFVPPTPNTIDVLGNVFNAGAQLYAPQLSAHQYLKLAGGKTRSGEKDQEYLLRADGTVLSRTTHARFDKLIVYPGDTIVVPAKLKTGFNLYQALSLAQSLTGVAITALAFRSLQQ